MSRSKILNDGFLYPRLTKTTLKSNAFLVLKITAFIQTHFSLGSDG